MVGKSSGKLTVAADASFLIGICLVDQVALLGAMFERVYVAAAVWEEVVVRGRGRPGEEQIRNAAVIVRQELNNAQAAAMLQLFLGPGESETLTLAQELSLPLVLMDDLRARKAARQAGIQALGVVGFLLAAKHQGLIDRIRPHLDTLQTYGFRLGQKLIAAALQQAGET